MTLIELVRDQEHLSFS